MIAIIAIPEHPLHMEEFVRPLREILSKIDDVTVIHYKEIRNGIIKDADAVVISGTAIKDFEYLENINRFRFILDLDKIIVGICAGAQIIALLFGGELRDCELIGVKTINLGDSNIRAYFLATKCPVLNDKFEVLGTVGDIPVFFKIRGRRIYGMLFHPEVLNPNLLTNVVSGAMKNEQD